MFDTFALLMSEIFLQLGAPPPEVLGPEDAAKAITETMAFYGLSSQQSAQSRITKRSQSFFPTTRDFQLTVAPDMMVPSFVERKYGTDPYGSWDYVFSVDKSMIEEEYVRGNARCAFRKEANGWFLQLSYVPLGAEHRLNYYTDPGLFQSLDDPLLLPNRFGFMFMHRSVVNAVPPMMMRIAKLPAEAQPGSELLEAISMGVGHSQAELVEWHKLWEREREGDRNPRGRSRRKILGGGGGSRRTY